MERINTFEKKDINTWRRVNYREPIFELFKQLTVVYLVCFSRLSRHDELPRYNYLLLLYNYYYYYYLLFIIYYTCFPVILQSFS